MNAGRGGFALHALHNGEGCKKVHAPNTPRGAALPRERTTARTAEFTGMCIDLPCQKKKREVTRAGFELEKILGGNLLSLPSLCELCSYSLLDFPEEEVACPCTTGFGATHDVST